jgi:hypothetical protein
LAEVDMLDEDFMGQFALLPVFPHTDTAQAEKELKDMTVR